MTSPITERLLFEAAAEIKRLSAELAEARVERDRAALVAADEANRADVAEAALAEREAERDRLAADNARKDEALQNTLAAGIPEVVARSVRATFAGKE